MNRSDDACRRLTSLGSSPKRSPVRSSSSCPESTTTSRTEAAVVLAVRVAGYSAIWTTNHSRPPPRATPAPPICALWRTIHRCSGEFSHARTTDRMLPPVPIVSPAQVAPSGRRSWLWNRSPASAICSACRCERRIIPGSARTGRRSSAIRWRLTPANRSSWASDAPTAGPRTRRPAVATAMSRRITHQVPRSLRAGSSGANAPTP